MRLGYEYQSLKDADIHPETRIFLNRFVPAIQRINRDKNLTVEQILATIEEIHGIIKNNDMGKEFLGRLLDQTADIKLIDFDHPKDNDFAVVDELTFGPEAKGSFRPDINILVNGIPLGFLEVKKPNNEGGIQKEFHRMLDERLQVPEFKKYFNMLQFVTFSNNMEYETDNDAAPAEEVRAGSFYSTPNGNRTFFSFFREENPKTSGFKEIYMDEVRYILKDNGYSPSYADTEEFRTNLQPSTPCNRFVTSFFDISRMMYLLQYGFFYVDTIDEKTGQPVTQKHIMRYPQFFASQAILKRIDGGGKSGIIFHTQGSGKTELSAFSTRIIRDYYSERGITAKFYYVVDRLDLLIQVRDEMRNRGLNAIEVNSRSDFEKELKRPLPKRGDLRSNGEIVVVNIQKFTDALPQVSNVYDAKIQRIFFVDEAHRSYKQTGQFFKNLMLVDDNAIYIAMTGTPLLSKKERSNLKFGDYIHKYFYDKSISDGYTLRIKKEEIDTTVRADIHRNLQFEKSQIDAKKDTMRTDRTYISSLGKFIETDFLNFRLVNADSTIGGMIVCSSNPQARKVKEWFDKNVSTLETGLVISDEDAPRSDINKETQKAFRKTLKPDILIVHQMLTTGYDVPRLKKMYLLRNAKEHTLLQTISRVNRPYKNPKTGKVYQYGYIVDFVDIEKEYDRTIEMYLKEMEDDFNDDSDEHFSLAGLVIGPEDIDKKYHAYQAHMNTFAYQTANPPFKLDFSSTRDAIEQKWSETDRFFAGVPKIPASKKESMAIYLLFIQHIMYCMKDNGKAAIVVPTGFLTAKSKIEYAIRQRMVDEGMLKGVISMPSNIFANTGTNVSILFLDKANTDGKVLLLDASKLGTKVKDGKNQKTVLSDDEVARIINTFVGHQVEDDFSVSVSTEDIKNKGYSFSAGQYFEVKIEHIDITAEEFQSKMGDYKARLSEQFAKGRSLEESIMNDIGGLRYDS